MNPDLPSVESVTGHSPAEKVLGRHVFLSRDASGACTTLYDEVVPPTTVEPSPFTPMLHTNYFPSEEDVMGIRRAMGNYEEKASKLDEEIAEVLTALSMKIAQRDAYLKAREDHRVLITPVHRIPFDLMQQIFYETSYEAFLGASHGFTKLKRHPSIVISQVCRAWRQISLQSPRLWAKTDITCPLRVNESARALGMWARKMLALTEMTKLFMARSGAAPLSLKAWVEDLYTVPSDSTVDTMRYSFREFATAVLQSSTRWKHFSLTLDVSSATRPLLDIFRLTPAQLGNLESLDININLIPDNVGSSDVHDSELFQLQQDTALLSVPSLRRLSVKGDWRDIAPPETKNALPTLEFLELSLYNPQTRRWLDGNQLLRIIRGIPTLTQLTFRHDAKETVPILRLPSPVIMPALTSMTLEWPTIPVGWASSIIAPALRNLHVKYCYGGTIQGVNSGFVEMYHHFGSALTTTSFPHTSLTPVALISILDNLPNLEELDLTPAGERPICRVEEPHIGSDLLVLAELNGLGVDGVSIRCPKLQVFKMAVQDEHTRENIAEEAIADFVQIRLLHASEKGGRCLREVDVLFWENVKNRVLDVGRELENRGFALDDLVLKIHYR